MTWIQGDAQYSLCGKYRYLLSRIFESGEEKITWIMLNPSKADAMSDDPTIARCVTFSERLRAKEIRIVNLFAFCATKPGDLKKSKRPVGKENQAILENAINWADLVILAWGNDGGFQRAGQRFLEKYVGSFDFYSFGTTKQGHPRHPLYLRKDSPLTKFEFNFTQ